MLPRGLPGPSLFGQPAKSNGVMRTRLSITLPRIGLLSVGHSSKYLLVLNILCRFRVSPSPLLLFSLSPCSLFRVCASLIIFFRAGTGLFLIEIQELFDQRVGFASDHVYGFGNRFRLSLNQNAELLFE